ncbi:uncharacterized protein PHA67_001056 isoform 1-T1 [Liasis olivaceus]
MVAFVQRIYGRLCANRKARMNFVQRCRWTESVHRVDVVSLPFHAEFGEQLTPQILVGHCIILPRWLTGKFSVPSFNGSSMFYEDAVFYKPSEARLTATPATVPKPLCNTSRTCNLFLNRLRLLGAATVLPSATEKLSQHKEGCVTQTVLARHKTFAVRGRKCLEGARTKWLLSRQGSPVPRMSGGSGGSGP